MGFSFRKRIRIFKGLNLNLSKSGVSLSGGVKGLRVRQGVLGDNRTTLYAGRGGFQYIKTLSGNSKKKRLVALSSDLVSPSYDKSEMWVAVNKLRDEAFVHMNKKEYGFAESKLKKAIGINDKLGGGVLYEMLAEIYVAKKDYKDALEMYYKSLKISGTAQKRKKILKIQKILEK